MNRFYGYNRRDYYFPRTSREAFGENLTMQESKFHKVMMWVGWALAIFLFFAMIGNYS